MDNNELNEGKYKIFVFTYGHSERTFVRTLCK